MLERPWLVLVAERHVKQGPGRRDLDVRHRRSVEQLDKLRHQAFAERRAGLEQFAQILDPATGKRVADDADANRAHDRPRRLMSELGIKDLAQRHDLADLRHPLLPSILKGAFPANRARGPSASSMRKASFHFAMRSERAKEPTLSCPTQIGRASCRERV